MSEIPVTRGRTIFIPAALALVLCLAQTHVHVDRAVAQASGQSMLMARFVGTNSCVHCHKNGHRLPTHAVAGREYSIWVNRDPHSCAYATLFKEKSRSIAKILKLKVPAHRSDLCLNCHSTNAPAELKVPESTLDVTDGVGCESCHGGAEHWLVPHKLPQWQSWSASEKESIGFVNTDDVVARTRTCVDCHVGGEGREVNHDLIAAGHPRLLFEMSAYQAKMPRHWSREKDLEQNSAMVEARLWLAGQFVSATAALDHLQRRANDLDAPWPEFAEYDCTSCHHDLADQRWKDNVPPRGNASGTPPWGTWHFALLENLSQSAPMSDQEGIGAALEIGTAVEFGKALDKLRKEMQRVLPDRDDVSVLSLDLRSQLMQMADCISTAELNEDRMLLISKRLFDVDPKSRIERWDGLTQRYLAAVALRQSLMDSRWMSGRFAEFDFQDSKNRLLTIRDSLKFIEDRNGPAKLDTSEEQSIQESFSAIFDPFGNQ